MINVLNSIKLRGSQPNTYIIDFKKENVSQEDSDISLAISTILNDSKDDPERLKLTFEVKTEARDDKDAIIFSMNLKCDYLFEIVNREEYFSLAENDRSALCASFCFIDFRRKILTAFANAGISGVKIPLSLLDLQGE